MSDLYELTGFTLTTGSNTISYSYLYTKNGLLDQMTGDGKTFSFIYDDGDNLINRTNPDQTKDSYTYNEANQIVGSQTVQLTIGTDIYTQALKWGGQYTYNANGKLSEVSGTRPSGTSFTESYIYNDVNGTEKLNRLTKATITDGTTPLDFDYSYDPAGNLLTMDVANGTSAPTPLTFTYDADIRITNSGFTYDSTSGTSNGNLTSAVINGNNYTYVYDSSNRLTTVKDGTGAIIASYTYGGDGQRLTKTIGTTTTTYHYFQGQLMSETLSTDASNVIHTLYLRSVNGALLGVRLYNGSGYNYYYYHYNSQGDVVAVTDSNGAVYRQYVYDPYGNVISVKDGSNTTVDINNDTGFNNAYTYRGYRYDSETGLYFLNARYYAAGIGRFLTKDTLLGSTSNPQSLNRYAYCEGDPVNLADHDGNRPSVTGGPEGLDVAINASKAKLADVGQMNSKNNPVLAASAAKPWHPDYSLDKRKYLHWKDGNYNLRFNSDGKIVEHSGKIIGEPKGRELKVLDRLMKAAPKFFSKPQSLIPMFYIPIDYNNYGLSIT